MEAMCCASNGDFALHVGKDPLLETSWKPRKAVACSVKDKQWISYNSCHHVPLHTTHGISSCFECNSCGAWRSCNLAWTSYIQRRDCNRSCDHKWSYQRWCLECIRSACSNLFAVVAGIDTDRSIYPSLNCNSKWLCGTFGSAYQNCEKVHTKYRTRNTPHCWCHCL